MKPPTATEHWRRLSIDLKHERNPFICQSCGDVALTDTGGEADLPEPEEAGFIRWQEHDQQDRPQPIYLVLCKQCSDRLIEPHERLYRPLGKWAPALGAMRFCLHCKFRDGLHCSHPDSKENGGPGLKLIMPKPTWAHLNYGGGKGEFRNIWIGAIKECGGFVSLPMLDEYLGMFDNLDAAHDSDCGSQFCPQCGGEEEHKANCPDA
jgi:hypothetical protein